MSKTLTKPFILVDGSSYLYRAFYALPPLTNSQGLPTGAIYGVINMLRRLLKDYDPDHIAVVFDAKGKTFRDDLFKAYKATRPPMPDDLKAQIEPLKESVVAMGLPLLVIDGVEADDVIATLATQADAAGMQTLISTGDKDIAQVVNENITLINTMSNTILDPEGVKEKFGIPPHLIVDYLALVGDKSDNIPGVPNVGPKTAVKWLTKYGDIDGIINHKEEITGKVGENLRSHLDELALSRQLATVKLDVALDYHPKGLTRSEPDNNKLKELFTTLEFRRLLTEVSEKNEEPKEPVNYQIILTEEDLNQWIKKIEAAELLSFDTETDSLDYMNANLVGLSFAVNPNEAAYLPVAHDYEDAPIQLSREFVLEKLTPLLENNKIKKVGQNLKYDKHILKNYDVNLEGIMYDTMLESYVINSSGTRHDMDTLALRYLGHRTIHFEDVAGKGKKQITFNQVKLDVATPYAAEDADITLKLHQHLWPKVEKEKGIKHIFERIEMPLLNVLACIERNGVLIDSEKLTKQSQEIAQRLETLQESAYESAGERFNLASPKQLQEILFNKLKLPVKKKTPKGQPSTAEAVLQELALDYPLPKTILEYRSLSKLKSTYTDALPQKINSKTGRVHTSYNQAITATGRLSSTDPNLQNIPVRTEQGRRIRQAFIARDGYKIVSADYSQIELRIMAHLSKDEGLLKAFAEGQDIHTATAAEVFGKNIDEISTDERRHAKAVNFGLIYGMSAYGLSRQLGIEPKTAQNYMDLYFQRYPGVKNYMETTREFARHNGFVETLYGRRLYLPDINASNFQRKTAAERAAINAPMQGTAADIIKMAMIDVHAWLKHERVNAIMIMQVHDELVFEVLEKDCDTLIDAVKELMETCAVLAVPLTVDVGLGCDWDEAH